MNCGIFEIENECDEVENSSTDANSLETLGIRVMKRWIKFLYSFVKSFYRYRMD